MTVENWYRYTGTDSASGAASVSNTAVYFHRHRQTGSTGTWYQVPVVNIVPTMKQEYVNAYQ